ncbi:hypothetical protein HBO18_04285 [Pseudomonas lactis]|uniref:Uncharacterized protein n=1 Tax=Pseudomonas lactis TaxID=1615674 RepID=A0A7Y1PX65_9PSED|nr:hypothetical protein [Pseudomonas lactis]NNA43342.1 hypothetical protein [Pseudomonas lactis]
MDAAAINKLISRLGRTYAELISEGLIFRGSLMPLLDTAENEEWVQFPVEGVELWFAKKNVIFEKVLCTAAKFIFNVEKRGILKKGTHLFKPK